MVTKEQLGHNIQRYMSEKKMTQGELATNAGITQTKVSNYVTGKNFPPVDVLAAIAEALEVSTDMLIYGEEAQNNAQIRTWGDVAKFLFKANFVCGGIEIKTKEEHIDLDGNTQKRPRAYLSFVDNYTWGSGEEEFNKMLCEWNEFSTALESFSPELQKKLFETWESAQQKELNEYLLPMYEYFAEMSENKESSAVSSNSN